MTSETALLLTLFLSILLTGIGIPLLYPLADKVGLVDTPDERKTHRENVPLIGGFAVFLGVSMSILLSQEFPINFAIYLCCAVLIVTVGVLDDFFTLTAQTRLLCQILITVIMWYGAGLYLQSFGSLLGLGELKLGVFGYFISVIAVIGAINAFNMIDGIDGLAGINAIISFSALAILFGEGDQSHELLISLVFITALLPYLAYNLKIPPFKKKVFLGDAGSMLIGFTIVWLLFQGTQHADISSFRPVTALWIIALPLVDMAAIMVRRVCKGRSPFEADRDHLHHIFIRAGFSDRQTLIIISGLSAILTGIGVIGEWLKIPEVIMFTSFLLFFAAYQHALKHSWLLTKWAHKYFKLRSIHGE